MKDKYVNDIIELMDQTDDISLLDFIKQLLLKSNQ